MNNMGFFNPFGGGSTGSAATHMEFMPASAFPTVGQSETLYVDTTGNQIYYWDGVTYRSLSTPSSTNNEIIARTVQEWAASPGYISKAASFYIYTNYELDQETGQYLPALKIGDGNTTVENLPFFCGLTPQEKEALRKKISVKIDDFDPNNLLFIDGLD